MPTYPRIQCCVPGCRRWSTRFPHEWLCGDHWRLVDRALKRLRTRAYRRCCIKASKGGYRIGQFQRLEAMIWRRMKRQAIERAMGIS